MDAKRAREIAEKIITEIYRNQYTCDCNGENRATNKAVDELTDSILSGDLVPKEEVDELKKKMAGMVEPMSVEKILFILRANEDNRGEYFFSELGCVAECIHQSQFKK